MRHLLLSRSLASAILCLAACLLVLSGPPALAQHLGARLQWQPETMPADPRLDQPVEIEIIGRAAVPALELLSQATGVSLGVAPEDLNTVGERKLTLISHGLTLKAVMVQLPEALQECHWDIDTSGNEPVYLLHRNAGVGNLAEREREDRRRQVKIIYQDRRRECIEDARHALAMSPEELAELEKSDLFLARAAQHPLWRELMESYVSLADEYRDQLTERGRLSFRYPDAPPSLRAAVGVAIRLEREHLHWARTQVDPADLSPPYGVIAQEAGLAEAESRLADGSLTIHVLDYGREGGFGPQLVMDWEGAGETTPGATLVPPIRPRATHSGNWYQWLLVATGDTPQQALDIVQRSARESQRLRDERQWDDSDWIEPSDPRLHQKVSIPVYGTEQEGNQYVSLLELQQLVAAETGLSIIADYFTEAGAGLYAGQHPLGEALWRDLYILGQTGQYEWRLAGDALVFHHTNWAWLAARELPESLLSKYRTRLAEQGHFTLDDAIEFAIDTEGHPAFSQRGGAAVPHALNKEGLGQGRGHGVSAPLLFYNSLTSAQQTRARKPGGLPLAELHAKGRSYLLRYVPVGGSDREESVREILARRATFSLTVSRGEQQGRPYTEYVFTFTFPEDADVPDHVVSSAIRLPEIAATAQGGGDRGGPDDQGGDP